MSRAARRMLSWLVCAAVLGAAGLAVWALPGGPPPEAELRWLLGRGQLRLREYRRADGLLRKMEGTGDKGANAMLRKLLDDPRDNVVEVSLRLLGDRLSVSETREGAAETFAAWWRSAALDVRIRHRSSVMRCWLMARDLRPLEPEDRWLVVLAAESSQYSRDEWVWIMEPERRHAAPWVRRLNALISLDERGTTAGLPKTDEIAAGPSSARLVEMLDDPNPTVARAAARLLVVCGDARGIPGTLASIRPQSMEALLASEVLGELFGPDWRSLDAGGGAAREPGAGDGGG